MTIGKITSSNQDIVMVTVRPETGSFFETQDGTVFANYNVINSAGQLFHTNTWITRLKIKLSSTPENSKAEVTLYDSPEKTKTLYQGSFMIYPGESSFQVLHLAFDPLPPGDYYWELSRTSGVIGISVCTNSTHGGAYLEGENTPGLDFESKLMLASGEQVERAVAVVGDEVDAGITTVKDGSSLMQLHTGVDVLNISREGDMLENGGKILTGSWFVELED